MQIDNPFKEIINDREVIWDAVRRTAITEWRSVRDLKQLTNIVEKYACDHCVNIQHSYTAKDFIIVVHS